VIMSQNKLKVLKSNNNMIGKNKKSKMVQPVSSEPK